MDQFKEDLKAKGAANLDLNLLRMIETRITEIVQIEDEIKKKYPKLFQQRLPRFMRRRSASANPKRIPKRLRSTKNTAKDRKRLFAYRRRIRFLKHKRILARHALHRYKDPDKCVLHKWFAKRFKMGQEGHSRGVPLHNNTKNQRNLYRQTRYGCAYLSMAHLIAFKIELPYSTENMEKLNQLTKSTSGFTFSARALESGRYEVVVHLHKSPDKPSVYLCPALVSNHSTHLTLWVSREHTQEVEKLLKKFSIPHSLVPPRDQVRLRLLGQNARDESKKIAQDTKTHDAAIEDADNRLQNSTQGFGATIGRLVVEQCASFSYYLTEPLAVDIVFRGREGRLLWHKLIKNKAHLVGGKRDVDRLVIGKCFELKPDYE